MWGRGLLPRTIAPASLAAAASAARPLPAAVPPARDERPMLLRALLFSLPHHLRPSQSRAHGETPDLSVRATANTVPLSPCLRSERGREAEAARVLLARRAGARPPTRQG